MAMRQSEMIKRFGNPISKKYPDGWCRPDYRWVYNNLCFAELGDLFMVHCDAYLSLRTVFEVSNTDFIHTVWGWSARCKLLNPKKELSTHAFGLAIDINPEENPYGSKKHNLSEQFIFDMERYGWAWGGRWGTPDPMHFQYEGWK